MSTHFDDLMEQYKFIESYKSKLHNQFNSLMGIRQEHCRKLNGTILLQSMELLGLGAQVQRKYNMITEVLKMIVITCSRCDERFEAIPDKTLFYDEEIGQDYYHCPNCEAKEVL
jgi:DNA-directed RNA polymerase subunit RPC12/RpoP